MWSLRTMSRQFIFHLVVLSYVCSTTQGRLRTCRSDNNDVCAVLFINGTEIDSYTSQYPCTCSNDFYCGADNIHSNHALRLTFTKLDGITEFYVLFCERIDHMRMCNPSEVPLRLFSSMEREISLESHNCRCKDHTEFRQACFGRGSILEYKCGEMPVCTADQVWAAGRPGCNEQHCKCLPPMIPQDLSFTNALCRKYD